MIEYPRISGYFLLKKIYWEQFIGCDFDQSASGSNNILTSSIKKADIATQYLVYLLEDGQWQGGTNRNVGVREGAIDIASTSSKHIPQSIIEES